MADTPVDLKTEAITSVIRQGPAWVILAGILYVIWSGGSYCVNTMIPAHLTQIQSGYEALQERQDATVQRIVDVQVKDRDAMIQQHAIMSQALTEIRDTNASIKRLVDTVQTRPVIGKGDGE